MATVGELRMLVSSLVLIRARCVRTLALMLARCVGNLGRVPAKFDKSCVLSIVRSERFRVPNHGWLGLALGK